MFGIGWGEMAVVGLVALIVIGPEKLPEAARTVGKFYGQMRQAIAEAGEGLSKEVEMLKSDTSNPVKELRESLPIHPEIEEIKKSIIPETIFSGEKTGENTISQASEINDCGPCVPAEIFEEETGIKETAQR